jgi:tetratricopeptide (TPR) repeat protein
VAKEGPNAPSLLLRGGALRQLGRSDEAESEISRSIALNPSVEAYLERAQLNYDKPDECLADIDRAVALNPKSALAFVVRANFYKRKGDVKRAISESDHAVELAPENFQARSMRADLLASDRQYDRALKDADALLDKQPGNPVLLNNRCWFRALAGQALDLALADCDASLKIKDSAMARDSRGLVNLRLGRLEDAITDYDTALALTPNQAESLFGRGLAKLRSGKKTEGEADLAAARASSSNIDSEFAGYGLKP